MDKKCRLVAKGVKDISKEELAKHFKTNNIELVGKGAKVAFIQYENPQQITEIYDSVKNLRINGKNLKVEYCIPKNRYEERKKEFSENHKSEKKGNDRQNKNNKKNVSRLTNKKGYAKIKFCMNEEDFIGTGEKSKKIKMDGNKKNYIFVNNLFYNITDEKINEIFSKYGEVKNIFRKYNSENKFNGRISLEFNALPKKELFEDEIIFENLLLEVEGENKKESGDDLRLFISNIKKTVKPKELKDLLKKNNIEGKINMKLDGLKKRNYGYCHIQFKKEEDRESFIGNIHAYKELGEISYEYSK